MNYKITTFVLAILLIAVSIYAWYLKTNPDCYNRISRELHKELIKEKFDEDTGGRIGRDSAKKHLDRYKKEFNVNCKNPDKVDLYGFAFGMNEFKKYAEEIIALDETYNFRGVRIYMSLKEGMIGGKKEKYHDVFLVPVASNGDNIYDELDDCTDERPPLDVPDSLVLNTSMLCPNRCE